ncbi:MAG: MgtC/SapB family protein [Clostridiales bacterium]|nr:MgtC/SapB family protein [Clostridiales bacterium]
MAEIINYLSEFNIISIFLRLILAVMFGGIIGLERRMRKRNAGLRTFALVCAGSALAMLTNEYLILRYEMAVDPGRMASQVISGVGFLGVGTIILNGEKVRGLTTAASLWATAAVGIAVGSGFFLGAFFGFFVIFVSTTFMHKFEERADKNNKFITVYIEIKKEIGMACIVKYIADNDFSLYSVDKLEKREEKDDLYVYVEINLKRHVEHGKVILDINLLDGVVYAEEIK